MLLLALYRNIVVGRDLIKVYDALPDDLQPNEMG